MNNDQHSAVQIWNQYWGALHRDLAGQTVLYGFENETSGHRHRNQAAIPGGGACFGYVAKGEVQLQNEQIEWRLTSGQWFSIPDQLQLNLKPNSRMAVMQCLGYQGVYAMGGPIEAQGRLRYIDGCSDTLLCPPPLLGDPCLNQLHFPAAIRQTPHTHPSLRAGMIAKGQGVCQADSQTIQLAAGMLFYIAKDAEHCFITETATMDVIAYHPDSDWGPTHEDHPMVNRTWVAGHKIDNLEPKHQAAIYIQGRS